MLGKIDLNNLELVEKELFEFIWNFKHGDNIIYNFKILQALYLSRSDDNIPGYNIFNKPITITIVSIVESILIDLLIRIDQATSHLPAGVSQVTLNQIKKDIEKQKKPIKIEDDIGERIYLKRKMYQFREIINILEKYELFGKKTDDFYKSLKEFGEMRNRVHIENYHRNFEDRERDVFTQYRLNRLENIISDLWEKMITDYKRPW
jgi:hypothetical protein